MDINSSCWLYDYGFDISVAAADFMATDSAGGAFTWAPSNMRWVFFSVCFTVTYSTHITPQRC